MSIIMVNGFSTQNGGGHATSKLQSALTLRYCTPVSNPSALWLIR